MITFFLALLIQAKATEQAPEILAPFTSERACLAAADDVNKKIAGHAEARKAGLEAVCLKVTRGQEV